MKYSEMYTPDFLEILANKSSFSLDEFIDNLDENGNDIVSIDINFIAEKLNVQIEYEDMPDNSGAIENGKITVDNTEPIERQRFTIGHEIGHYMLGDTNAAIKDSNTGYSRTDMEHEKIANAVSAELLMPRKLVLYNIDNFIQNQEWDEDSLSNDQLVLLIDHVAAIMQVSVQAFKYRIKNLQLFTE